MSILFLVIPLSVFLIFSVAIFYLLKRYDFKDPLSGKMTVFFLAMSGLTVGLTVVAYFFVDWGALAPPEINFPNLAGIFSAILGTFSR